MNIYVYLCLTALIPTAVSAGLYLAGKKTFLSRLPHGIHQGINGLLLGFTAVLCTWIGVNLEGTRISCSDAAVMCAGLLFSGRAGFIAAAVAALGRMSLAATGACVYGWVSGALTPVIIGVAAMLTHRFILDRRRPFWSLALGFAAVTEVLSLLLLVVSHMEDTASAVRVIANCALPQMVPNVFCFTLATQVTAFLSPKQRHNRGVSAHIMQTVQRGMLLTVTLAFVITTVFVYSLQTQVAMSQVNDLLKLGLDDLATDIKDTSDENLLDLARRARILYLKGNSIFKIKDMFDVAEVNVVDRDGIIIKSTDLNLEGFDMASGEQSSAFLCLLNGENEYVQEFGPISYDSGISRKYAGVSVSRGFLQVGYGAEQFQTQLQGSILELARNRHVGQNGFLLILDSQSNVLQMPSWMLDYVNDEPPQRVTAEENTTFPLRLWGVNYYCRYVTTEGYIICAMIPQDEAFYTRNVAIYSNTAMEILVFAVLFVLIYLLIRHVVLRQIGSINGSLRRITAGNLDEVVNVRTNQEFAELSDDINSTVNTLKNLIGEANARIDQELAFARTVQMSSLPAVTATLAQRPEFEISASILTAKEVGGDFYDFYLTRHSVLHFLVADVSGKGIPAAMFMMRARTELRNLSEAGQTPADVFTEGNRVLCEGNEGEMFVTAWQGELDLKTGMMTYVNAGHNPPLVKRADGSFEYLRSRPSLVLAAMEMTRYREQQLQLMPGDTVFLYTDGVTEATDAGGHLFGEERLQLTLNRAGTADVNALCEAVKAAVDAFVGEAPQFDDITMLAIRYRGEKKN